MDANKKKEVIRAVKFALFSASAGLIEFASFALLNETLHLPYHVSYIIALVLSVLWNFTLNRKYTFKSAANVPVAMLKVAAYYAVFTPLTTIGGNYLTEKAAIAALHTRALGCRAALSLFDCVLMRQVYRLKYSKQKKG